MLAAVLLVLAQDPAGSAPYWQQRLDYDIQATLDEPAAMLRGSQTVIYHNNSPDTLHSVSFHLYLNAFRPGSRWSDRDSVEGRRRFNDLRDPDYAFNTVHDVSVDGVPVVPVYPFAPDSTVVRFALPRAIAPRDSFVVSMGWEARPSTVPRRQARRGRQYDFAHWYPRVVAYDRYGWAEHPLYPAGEFYGDFGDFRVTLDVPQDQVVGATGVPVCGDPGWSAANMRPSEPVALGREAYGEPRCEGGAEPAPGRKRIVWQAKDVHHFALSMSPDYRYEGGRFGNVLVHVLYQPGDTATWGGGIAVERTVTALRWLDQLFGPFPWPQITNLHRIDRGSTEFPMMVHDASVGQSLIMHEVGHNYLMGILANNEWREAFLDEGFTNFQTSLYNEPADTGRAIRRLERDMLLLDLDGWSEPVSQPGEAYRDMGSYSSMSYNRGELFYHQLRAIIGDSAMRVMLRTLYDRWKLKHFDEAVVRGVAEEVSGMPLSRFFAQWLHGTTLYDYAVGRVESRRLADAPGWSTRVEVVRRSPGEFPVDVVARSRADSARIRVSGTAEREWVTLRTAERPRQVEVDPDLRSHDWNRLDNRKRRGLLGYVPDRRRDVYLDPVFSQRTRRDGLTVGLVPALWYNDEGGVTVGGRIRTDYLGRFEQHQLTLSFDTDNRDRRKDGTPGGLGAYLKLRNPVRLYMPRTAQELEAWWVEGRAGLAGLVERQTNEHRTTGPQTFRGVSLRWMVTTDTRYLDPALWDGGGTVEAEGWLRSRGQRGAWAVSGRIGAGGGVEYRNRGSGLSTDDSYDAQPYVRAIAFGTARRAVGTRATLSLRGYGGWVESGRRVLKQRQLFVAGADPYEQFANPFLRSRGSLLRGHDVHYQMPGGGGLRGLAPGTTATRLLAINAEADRLVLDRPGSDTTATSGMRLFSAVRIAAFGDAALGNGDIPPEGKSASLVADAGIGLRIRHRIGQTRFVSRLDVPLLVTRPRLAADETDGSVQFRWVISFGADQ